VVGGLGARRGFCAEGWKGEPPIPPEGWNPPPRPPEGWKPPARPPLGWNAPPCICAGWNPPPPIVTVGQAFDPATMGAGANPPCPGPCPGANDAWGAGAGAREPIAPAMWPMIALGSARKNDI
jgi:hypothetical protein